MMHQKSLEPFVLLASTLVSMEIVENHCTVGAENITLLTAGRLRFLLAFKALALWCQPAILCTLEPGCH